MLKDEHDSLLAPVLAWPETAQEKLVHAIREFEAQNCSRFEERANRQGRAMAVAGQFDFIAMPRLRHRRPGITQRGSVFAKRRLSYLAR